MPPKSTAKGSTKGAKSDKKPKKALSKQGSMQNVDTKSVSKAPAAEPSVKPSSKGSRYNDEKDPAAESVIAPPEENKSALGEGDRPDLEDPDEINMQATKETRGANLADVDVDKSFAATEKLKPEEEGKFYDENNENFEKYTDVDKRKDSDHGQVEDDGMGLFDDEDIQPNKVGAGIIPEETIATIIESWDKVAKLGAEKVGVVLFKNIFKIAPQALELFSFKDREDLYSSKELKMHGAAVVGAVGTAVAGLTDLKSIVPILQNLGMAHARKGILPEHYPIVGQALQNTLKAGLKADYTPAVKDAWDQVFKIVSDTMIGDFYTNPELLTDDLTEKRISLVQESWAKVVEAGFDKVGSLIFRRLFEVDHNLINLFHFSQYDNWQENEVFIGHVTKVAGVFTKAIEHLGSMDQLVGILNQIGGAHIPRGVKD